MTSSPLSVRHLGPNWFAAVMGTGIVATAAVVVPVQVPGQHGLAVVAWGLAVVVLLVLLAATAAHRLRHPDVARSHLAHPVAGHFYGAPPMALMTVGAGTLLVGRDVVGLRAAVAADVVLWSAGTLLGLASLVVVPLVARARGTYATQRPTPAWLMPVVPPMVSSTTGGLLVPHLPDAVRAPLLAACAAMFVLSLVASAVVLPPVVRGLRRHGPGPAGSVPLLLVVLGPLGQSMTAAHVLGGAADGVLAPVAVGPLQELAVGYAAVVGLLALAWAVVAVVLVVRTARVGLPFALSWWSFTFPVGTCVTGTAGLAVAGGSSALGHVSLALLAVLVTAWAVVLVRTVAGVVSGELLAGPAPVPAPSLVAAA